MAEDVDGNYYYDAGTVNELFDNVAVTEDSDGHLSLVVGGNEMRVHEWAHVFGAKRAAPGTDELSQSDDEHMLFVSDGSDANTADGDLAIARNPDGTVETATVVAATSFADK